MLPQLPCSPCSDRQPRVTRFEQNDGHVSDSRKQRQEESEGVDGARRYQGWGNHLCCPAAAPLEPTYVPLSYHPKTERPTRIPTPNARRECQNLKDWST